MYFKGKLVLREKTKCFFKSKLEKGLLEVLLFLFVCSLGCWGVCLFVCAIPSLFRNYFKYLFKSLI